MLDTFNFFIELTEFILKFILNSTYSEEIKIKANE